MNAHPLLLCLAAWGTFSLCVTALQARAVARFARMAGITWWQALAMLGQLVHVPKRTGLAFVTPPAPEPPRSTCMRCGASVHITRFILVESTEKMRGPVDWETTDGVCHPCWDSDVLPAALAAARGGKA